MTEADETRVRNAAKHSSAQLGVIEAAYGKQAAQIYAAGMALGIRNFSVQSFGCRASFDLFDELAIGALTPILPKGQ